MLPLQLLAERLKYVILAKCFKAANVSCRSSSRWHANEACGEWNLKGDRGGSQVVVVPLVVVGGRQRLSS